MARVRPFRAWRYASSDPDLSALCAPPYDVVSEAERAELLANDPRNIVALELPEGVLDPADPLNRYSTGKATWDAWRATGVLRHDDMPMIYVLEQRFELGGRTVRRRAFITEVALEPFDAGVVVPHERTLPKALGDRFELIKATGANFSQVFGMYEDPGAVTNALFDAVTATEPAAHACDADGVASTLWTCVDPAVADRLRAFMADKRIFIADGHHRYTTALAYRDLRREAVREEGQQPADPPYDHVMMALVNMDDPELVVLPYHRVADSAEPFDAEVFYERLREYFDVTELATGHPSSALEGHRRTAFLVKTRADDRPKLAVLRSDVDLDRAITADRGSAWKSLDVSIMQELVLWPLLAVHPERAETLDRLSFTKDAHVAFAATAEHDVALVLRPTGLDQLRLVALSGEMMPQKSTYFYPKLLSGLVMRSAE